MRSLLTAAFLLVFSGVSPGQMHVQDTSRLTVSGSGQVKVMPDTAVMVCGISGDGELAQDAVVKFRDAKRRAIEALEAIGIEGLKIEPMGMSMGAQYSEQAMAIRRGMPMDAAAVARPKVSASESLRLTVEGIADMEPEAMADMMSELVESVQDAGLYPGTGNLQQMVYQYGQDTMPLFVFQLSDPESKIAEARRLAVADAKQRAEALASETGVELGRVVYVNENVMNQNMHGGNQWQRMYMQQAMPYEMVGGSGPVISDSFSPVTVNVQVTIGYQIADEPAS